MVALSRCVRALSLFFVFLAPLVQSQLPTPCPPIAETLVLFPGEFRQISTTVDPLNIDILSWQSTACNSDFSLANKPAKWLSFNGTETLITLSLSPVSSGAGIIVFESNSTDVCTSISLAEQCLMYGYDTVSFTARASKIYTLAVTNMSASSTEMLLDINVALSSDAPLPTPMPEPDPIPLIDVSSVAIDTCIPRAFSALPESQPESNLLDTTVLRPSSCGSVEFYTSVHEFAGDGRVAVVEVCTATGWIAELEIASGSSFSSCTGSCIAVGEIQFDVKRCGSSEVGRLTRVQFLAEEGMSYLIRVMSPVIPDDSYYNLTLIHIPPSPNFVCESSTYLPTKPAVVAGNTNQGGLLRTECSISSSLGSSDLNKRSLWYKIVGRGGLMRANPCGRRTDFSARVLVFEQNMDAPSGADVDPGEHCAGPLSCVGMTDCAISSTGLDFLAHQGSIYFIVLTGTTFSDSGFFEMLIEDAPNATFAENPPIRTVSPLADSYRSKENIQSNADSSQAMVVGQKEPNDQLGQAAAILSFEIPPRDPSRVQKSDIKSASLTLYGAMSREYVGSGMRVRLQALDQNFDESNSSLVNRTAVGPVLDENIITAVPSFYEFDVTNHLRSLAIEGIERVSFSLEEVRTAQAEESKSSFWAAFFSKESPNILRHPKLTVEYFEPQPSGSLAVSVDADAYVLSAPSKLSKNHGFDEFIIVEDGPQFSDEAIGYIMVQLPSDLPSNITQISSATLELFGYASLQDGVGIYVTVHDAGSILWSEQTLVYRNRYFTSGAAIDSVPIGPDPISKYVFDVTSAVQASILRSSRRLTISLAAQGYSYAKASFYSKQSSFPTRTPKLTVNIQ